MEQRNEAALQAIQSRTETECKRLHSLDSALSSYERFTGAAVAIQAILNENKESKDAKITDALQVAVLKILFTALPTQQAADDVTGLRDQAQIGEADVAQYAPELAAKYREKPQKMQQKFQESFAVLDVFSAKDFFNPASAMRKCLNTFDMVCGKWLNHAAGLKDATSSKLSNVLTHLYQETSKVIELVSVKEVLFAHQDYLVGLLKVRQLEVVAQFKEKYNLTDEALNASIQKKVEFLQAAREVRSASEQKPQPTSPTTAHLLSKFREQQSVAGVGEGNSDVARRGFGKK